MRAGTPTVIVPFMADQPFWGYQAAKLGVGPMPIPRKKLTAGKLASAIRQLTTDEGIRQNAAALGEKIQGEDGVGNAVRLVGELLARDDSRLFVDSMSK